MSDARNVCSYCSKEFQKLKYLNRHIRVKHSEKNSTFTCGECLKEFTDQSNCKRHIRKAHLPGDLFLCPKCGKTFANSYNLERHKMTVHGNSPSYTCATCFSDFKYKFNWIRHIKTHAHGKRIEHCALCSFSDHRLSVVNHYQNEHFISIDRDSLTFPSFSLFESWRTITEQNETSWFVKQTEYQRECDSTKVIQFICHFDGRVQAKYMTKQRKVHGLCPAGLKVCLKDSEVQVEFTKTHVGHPKELRKPKIMKSLYEKENPHEIPLDEILSDNTDKSYDFDGLEENDNSDSNDFASIDSLVTRLISEDEECASVMRQLSNMEQFPLSNPEVGNDLLSFLDGAGIIDDLDLISSDVLLANENQTSLVSMDTDIEPISIPPKR